jgi:hypothetical protein
VGRSLAYEVPVHPHTDGRAEALVEARAQVADVAFRLTGRREQRGQGGPLLLNPLVGREA